MLIYKAILKSIWNTDKVWKINCGGKASNSNILFQKVQRLQSFQVVLLAIVKWSVLWPNSDIESDIKVTYVRQKIDSSQNTITDRGAKGSARNVMKKGG